MSNIEIIFTSNGQEPISWDMYPSDLDVQKTLKNLRARYPNVAGNRASPAPPSPLLIRALAFGAHSLMLLTNYLRIDPSADQTLK